MKSSLRHIALVLVALALPVSGIAAEKAAGGYELGNQYKKVREVRNPDDPKKISVEEFFWYGCIHCFDFDPLVQKWKATKPAYVSFEAEPITLGREIGALHQRAFYIASSLGVEDKIHGPMFKGLNEQHDNSLLTLEGIQALFQKEAGVTKTQFDGIASSFIVDAQMRRAETAAKSYGITGTPTIVVGGEYMATVQETQEGLITLTNFLIQKVKDERGQ